MTLASNKSKANIRNSFEFSLKSPVARQEQLLLSEYYSDVVFQVGSAGEMMHAHKLILTLASEVFFVQFNGGFAEAKRDNRENPILIEDFEPAVFREVLRYIYCEKVNLTEDNILDVYRASEKYLLVGLNTICKNYLTTTLNVHNVLKVLNANQRCGLANVNELCLQIIRDNPIKCFQSGEFLSLSQNALELIAACKTMNCQKDQLDAAIQKWCKTNDSTANIKPQLEALQCDKLFSFSSHRYDTDASTDLTFSLKGKMYLHGLGIFIGKKPSDPASNLAITVKIEPFNVTVSRTVCLQKNLYVEEILFEKLEIINECRIIVKLPGQSLFCLEHFKPIDTLGELRLKATDMKLTQPVHVYGYQLGKGTNCISYLLYSLNPTP